MPRNCTICGKVITLVPSAKERSRKYGNSPAYYESLFTEHSACTIKKRNEETRNLIRSKNYAFS